MKINGVDYTFDEVLRDGPIEEIGFMLADGSEIVIRPDKSVVCVEFNGTRTLLPEHLH